MSDLPMRASISSPATVSRTPLLRAAVWLIGILGALTLSAPPAVSQSLDADDASPHSNAELVSEVDAVAPGEPFTVALRIDMEEGWHSYWKNPGDSGLPTRIDWSLPEGFEAGDIQWPYPHRIDTEVLTSYGYSDQVHLLIEITPPASLEPGASVTLAGSASWLICADVCLPAEGEVETTLAVADSPRPSNAAPVIRAARSKLAQDVDGWRVQAARSTDSCTLALTAEGDRSMSLDGAQFFPAESSILDHTAPQPVSTQGRTHLIALQPSPYASAPVDTLRGVLVAPDGATWDPAGEVRAMTVSVPVESDVSIEGATASALGSSSSGGGLSLLWALLFAFTGGLLLNLMPCVFPVLSVKILGFAEQSGDASTMRRHGWLFGAGVLVSMWVLAGVLLGLRAAGSEIGWGFQLQSPAFVALMALLFVGIGLNLLGVFEIGMRAMTWGGRMQNASPSSGNTGAFMTGVLATVVATPCTAPFMGAALGVALTLSPVGSLLIFTLLGAGMATPYVGLSMAPRLLDRLPKPGAWMETLKQFFAFPMFATAVWLVWVFGQQTGDGAVALLLFGMLLLGMAAWVLHRWSAPQLSRLGTIVTRTLVLAMTAGAIATAVVGARYQPSPNSDPSASENASSVWMSYSKNRVEELRAEGRPVFVDFTAAWCLTCQVNERTVLDTEAVQDAFDERDVALVKADWTNRDPEITAALESFGRSGVPVYALYPGTGEEPTLLPEVLTRDIVLSALEAMPSSAPVSASASIPAGPPARAQ